MILDTKRYLVEPGTKVSLDAHEPADVANMTKEEGKAALRQKKDELRPLQQLLYASEKHALLVVLQGIDTSGKDGVIKHVMGACNPQGCSVTGFKVPTREELGHDFLWRVHKATPRRGMVGIFNRSHYEDVLVVRVESLVPESVWQKRYQAINQFEETLAESGVIILKFFLHISKEKQRERLQDRLDDPHDHWKFKISDLSARAKWDQYMAAYEAVLSKCSTPHAPWYVIPSDRKWFRNLLVSQIVVDRLETLGLEWPPLDPDARDIEIA